MLVPELPVLKVDTSTRLAGHGLLAEGKPFHSALGDDGRPRRMTGSTGYGRCSCGVRSVLTTSDAARKRWHKEHKNLVRQSRRAGAQLPDWAALSDSERDVIRALQELAARWPHALEVELTEDILVARVVRPGDPRRITAGAGAAIIADIRGLRITRGD